MSNYVELVFYGTNNCAVIRKVSYNLWDRLNANKLILSDQDITFLYELEDIKYYWKTFRCQRDSYELPFTISKLRISIKNVGQ